MSSKVQLIVCSCALILTTFAAGPALLAQENMRELTPETKATLDKFNKAPAAVEKTLKGVAGKVVDAATSALGAKNRPLAKPEPVDLESPRPFIRPYPAPIDAEGTRDPFRPFRLETKVNTRSRGALSPLERYELGQLKIVGVVWDIKEPRAMLEDPAGLGYVVTQGMPIGSKQGVVKSIHREGIVVEEIYNDVLGVQKKREVPMKLATE